MLSAAVGRGAVLLLLRRPTRRDEMIRRHGAVLVLKRGSGTHSTSGSRWWAGVLLGVLITILAAILRLNRTARTGGILIPRRIGGGSSVCAFLACRREGDGPGSLLV